MRAEWKPHEIDPESPAIAYLPSASCRRDGFPVPGGPLDGMPYLAKDLFDVAGWPTSASSRFLAGERGIPGADAELVRILSGAGAVCIGKTHLNEFAYGLSGENPHYGDCPHPFDSSRLSGGSSSGSACAVALGWVPFALGTDTGGSIRVPAAFCNVWGVRYRPGFLAKGCFPLAPSFDTVGILAQSASCLRMVNAVVTDGRGDPRPAKLTGLLEPEWCLEARFAAEYRRAFDDRGIPVDAALSRELGQWMERLPGAFSVLQSLEALEIHEPWVERYRESYDPAVLRRILRARKWTPEEIVEANRTRQDFTRWVTSRLSGNQCLVLPAVPDVSPPVASLTDGFRESLLKLTTPASLAGLPVVTEPISCRRSPFSLGLQYVVDRVEALDCVLSRFRDP